MTRDDVIRLAREAGDDVEHTLPSDLYFLERFASLVAEAQRAACASHFYPEMHRVLVNYERAVKILTGVHALLYPPVITDANGQTWKLKSPVSEEQMQELSDRIRAIPDELAALDAAAIRARGGPCQEQ